MIPETTAVIEQRVFLRGRQKLEILPDGNLEITFKKFLMHRQFQIPLWQILPSSERVKHFPVGYLVVMAVFLLLSLAVVMRAFEGGDLVLFLGLAGLFLCFFSIAFACLWKFQTESMNMSVFYLRQGGQVHVWFEKPDAKTFHGFCEALKKKSQDAWQNRPADPSQQSLAGEITALKRLKDDGILSEAEFEKAKAKLISAAEEKKIGFA